MILSNASHLYVLVELDNKLLQSRNEADAYQGRLVHLQGCFLINPLGGCTPEDCRRLAPHLNAAIGGFAMRPAQENNTDVAEAFTSSIHNPHTLVKVPDDTQVEHTCR
jgi:hypothetical protein